MTDEQTRSAAKAQFERIVVAAGVLLRRKPEILSGMAREGKTPEQCEAAFAQEMDFFLTDARRAAMMSGMPQRDIEAALFQFQQRGAESNEPSAD
jgi:2-hydroxychromene-2-carboxylate isomerase